MKRTGLATSLAVALGYSAVALAQSGAQTQRPGGTGSTQAGEVRVVGCVQSGGTGGASTTAGAGAYMLTNASMALEGGNTSPRGGATSGTATGSGAASGGSTSGGSTAGGSISGGSGAGAGGSTAGGSTGGSGSTSGGGSAASGSGNRSGAGSGATAGSTAGGATGSVGGSQASGAGGAGAAGSSYVLQGGTNMAQHVGHQVEITGTMASAGQGSTGTTGGTTAGSGTDRSGGSSSAAGTSGSGGQQMLRVTSVRTISSTCSR